MKKIVFKNIDGTIGIIFPTNEALTIYDINKIAQKDTPVGLPYWIVEADIIPTDREFRDAWEIDERVINSPNGYGSSICTF